MEIRKSGSYYRDDFVEIDFQRLLIYPMSGNNAMLMIDFTELRKTYQITN